MVLREVWAGGGGGEGGHDPVSVEGSVDEDVGGLSSLLVDDVQQLQGLAIRGGVELEVQR